MNSKRIKTVVASIVFGVFVLAASCVFIFLKRSDILKIDNFSEYYYDVPEKTQTIVFSELYNTVLKNSQDYVPNSGAIVRDSEPFLYTYNVNYDGYHGEFIVDIPEIQQSYSVEFNFSNDSGDDSIGGFAALVYCLPEDKMIYPDFGCKENLPFVTEEK